MATRKQSDPDDGTGVRRIDRVSMSRDPRVTPVGISWAELVIGPEPTFVFFYSDEAEEVQLHFDSGSQQFLMCRLQNCSWCEGPRGRATPFRLLPVLSLRTGRAAYLRVPRGYAAHSLQRLIAKAFDQYGSTRNVFGFSRNEVGEYQMRAYPIDELDVEQQALIHLFREVSDVENYAERRKGIERSRPSEAIPLVPPNVLWDSALIAEESSWDEDDSAPFEID